MNNRQLPLLINAYAINARIEGMRISNQARQENGYANAYGDDEFFAAERELEELARQAALLS